MSEPPGGWSNTRLGSLCSLLNGLPFRPDEWSAQGTPIIRIQNLNGGDDFNRYDRPIPAEYLIEPGTLLFSWSGNRGTSFGPYRWPGPTGILNQHIFKVSPRFGVDPGWLYYGLGIARARAEQAAHGGSGLVHVRRGDLQAYEIPTPPLPEQRQIAAILDTLDDAIRKTEQIIAKLKQVKQGLLHDLLTRGIDDNGELRDPERHPEQFKDSALGRIPRGWEVRSLDACVNPRAPITYGIVQAGPHVPDGIPYIRTGDMSGDRLALDGLLRTSDRVAASYTRSRVETDDIVCAIRATVGKVLPVPSELNGANLTQGTARIAPEPEMNPGFLLWALRGHATQRQFGLSVKGTTFREITLAQLRLLLVPVPLRRQEQDGIALVMQRAVGREDSESRARDKLRLMKAGLMEDLLTGRVRVTGLATESQASPPVSRAPLPSAGTAGLSPCPRGVV